METNHNDYKSDRIALIIINTISLVFCIEVLIKSILGYKNSYLNLNIYSTLLILIIFLMFFYSVYCILWLKKKLTLNSKFKLLIEIPILTAMFSIITIISGGDNSSFKALFIFVIVSATIHKGLKGGIIVSLISSSFILLIDLTFKQVPLTYIILENDIIICTMLIFLAWMLGYYINISRRYKARLKNLANKDGLTDTYNHKYFYKKLDEAINLSKITCKNLSLMFLDIDDFKCYNDLNGHRKGDDALKSLANILKDLARKNDTVARYGGEEFVVIMENTNESEAINLAEKIRLAIENATFYGEEKQPSGKLTVSIGISEYPHKAKSGEELVNMADDALYKAKAHNKNTVKPYSLSS